MDSKIDPWPSDQIFISYSLTLNLIRYTVYRIRFSYLAMAHVKSILKHNYLARGEMFCSF